MSVLRPRGFDDLGLRRAVPDRLLPFLVGAMAFLGALALAGAFVASGLARHWRDGAGAALTVQVPSPGSMTPEGGTRLAQALKLLRSTPGVLEAHALAEDELDDLLRPWLGAGTGRIALPLPAVIEVQFPAGDAELAALGARLALSAPGTLVESTDVWVRRLAVLARSLQACAALVVAMVGLVAVAVVAVATRSGLSARRDAVEIVHELGATDSYVAAQFARRATRLASTGAAAGALLALPVLLGLGVLASPFAGVGDAETGVLQRLLPVDLWFVLPALPVVAALIGWVTAQVTVRRWLRRLV